MKAVISIYRRGEEKPIERYKARISVTEDSIKQGIDSFKKHLADFLGLKEQANKLGLGSFDPKLYRLVKGDGKTENYSTLTRVLLKAGPRPSSSAARRPTAHDGPAALWPSPDFPHFFLCSGKSTRMHRSASGLGVQTLNLVTIFIII